jgi:hypothetical protein
MDETPERNGGVWGIRKAPEPSPLPPLARTIKKARGFVPQFLSFLCPLPEMKYE